MPNNEYLALLTRDVNEWNAWRSTGVVLEPDLSRAVLTGVWLRNADLYSANLSGANLSGADLYRCNLNGCNLRGADLSRAYLGDTFLKEAKLDGAILTAATLSGADLRRASMKGAIVVGADLSGARLTAANLTGADLTGAMLSYAVLVEATVEQATFSQCAVYGLSAWDLVGTPKDQSGLVISGPEEPKITLDSLKIAQFIHLLINNRDIRDIIDTITSKVVLILGRFSDERKPVLDALRESLRNRDLTPVIFDFAIPATRDVTETVITIAGLAKFLIVDITDATEVRAELHDVVPQFPSLPVKPIVLSGHQEFVSLPGHLARFPWVMDTFQYRDLEDLLSNLDAAVLDPLVLKHDELTKSIPQGRNGRQP